MNISRPPSSQPIPDHARKVFTGVLSQVYQWQQQLFDGTSVTFEKIKRLDSVNILAVTPENNIILTHQEQPGHTPFISAVGGQIDPGETPLEAAKRELLEEAGYEAQNWTLWDASQPSSYIDWAIYTFIAKDITKVKRPHLDGGEKIALHLVTFDELLETVVRDDYRDREVALKLLAKTRTSKEKAKLQRLFTH